MSSRASPTPSRRSRREERLDDAGWVANRWCEILPLPLEAKQRLMTLEDPVARLEVVDSLMRVRHQKQ